MSAIVLGPPSAVAQPDHHLAVYRNGDPKRRLPASRVNLNSVVAIQTTKSINDLSGTFTITLKDGRARREIREMDVIPIRLAGDFDGRLLTVLKGVVDEVRAAGSADPYASREDTIITGRCAGKYLQITSLFLPVWDPSALLPTALTFGLGDAAKKVGGNRPYDIFRYLILKYTYGGDGNIAGLSGVPNSRYWLDHYTRFAKALNFQVPYLQFDEDSMAIALKRMEVLGFTETWIDELGRIVYRQPGWDQPAAYQVHTDHLVDWDLNRSDVDARTYLEVIPAGDPGIDSATAQALRAGRAPVPSSYLKGSTSLSKSVSPEFVIETDAKGVPTAKGQTNHWYRLQRRLGVRPEQISSPLIFTQEQAQAQAEGLLRFHSRMIKGGTIVLPGAPMIRLGHTLHLHGELDGLPLNRAYYIEQTQHDYVFASHYHTTVTLSHGRDPWDPKWQEIVLPRFDPKKLSTGGGILDPGQADPTGLGLVDGQKAQINSDGTASAPKNAPAAVKKMIAKGNAIHTYPYAWGGGHPAAGRPSQSTRAGETQVGYDCSGATGALLAAAGIGLRPGDPVPGSGDFGRFGEAGRGTWCSVYYHGGHVFIEIAGIRLDTSDAAGQGGIPAGSGPRWRPAERSHAGFSVMHPRGL